MNLMLQNKLWQINKCKQSYYNVSMECIEINSKKFPHHSEISKMHLVVIKPPLINVHPSYYTAMGN